MEQLGKLSSANIPLMEREDDPLNIVLKLTYDVIENRKFRFLLILVFLFHSILIVITGIYFVMHPDLEVIIKYVAGPLGIIAMLMILLLIILKWPVLIEFRDICYGVLWSTSIASDECRKRISEEARVLKILLIVNSFCGVICGAAMWQVGPEEDYHLPTFYVKTHHPNLLFYFKLVYDGSFILMGYISLGLANIFCYHCYHGIFQMYITFAYLKNILNGYENVSDDVLLHHVQYQKLVTHMTALMQGRIIAARDMIEMGTELTKSAFPVMLVVAILMGLCIMCHLYMDFIFGKWLYVQMAIWCLVTVMTFCLFMFTGEKFTNTYVDILIELYNVRWTAFSPSNKKNLLILMMASQKPLEYRFLTFVVGYKLGIQILKVLYSFAASISKFREIQGRRHN